MDPLTIVLVTAPLWAVLCAVVASPWHRSVGGWAFAGLLFGPLAFLCLLISGNAYRSARPGELDGQTSIPRPERPESRDPFVSRRPR